MKSNPQIRRLLNGESPLSVFSAHDIREARKAFHQLREQFDFTFWAARNFIIPHISDPDTLTPLILSEVFVLVFNLIERRFFQRELGRYVITKEGAPCGLTTALQAYILWHQLYAPGSSNANICGASKSNILHLKANLARFLKYSNIPSSPIIRFPNSRSNNPETKATYPCSLSSVIFSSVKNPDITRGFDLRHTLFSDMSKWHDLDRINSDRAMAACLGNVPFQHDSFFILEGNRPKGMSWAGDKLQKHYDNEVKYAITPPSLLLEQAIYSSLHRHSAPFFHILI